MAAVIKKAVIRAREAFARNLTKSVDFRIEQLLKLQNCINENYDQFIEALKSDFRKPKMETVITELEFVKNDIEYQLDRIKEYVKPQYVQKGMANLLDDCYIKYDPFGVVLIFGAWNYPIQLLLCPLVGAISAGNCAVIKPSEVSFHTEQLLAKLIPKYLDQSCYHILTGGPDIAGQILQEKFDFIFFTGSPNIGKLVYQAASKYMTPVVLELGGKNPVYIDDSVSGSLETAAKRILWGKTLNGGQTCVAPDYVMCTSTVQEKFVQASRKVLKQFYKDNPKESDSFCRIVNERNFNRLDGLLSKTNGNVAIGGETDKETKYIAPTVVMDVTSSDSLMSEELFGPVLPIMPVQTAEEAIEFINQGEKPLTMYLFSNKKDVVNKFLDQTSSGSVCVNDCLVQYSVPTLPFGGIGNSGIGKYHGRSSFEAFSHSKSVLGKNYNPLIEYLASVRYPPYSEKNLKKLKALVAKTPFDGLNFKQFFSLITAFVIGFVSMYALSLW